MSSIYIPDIINNIVAMTETEYKKTVPTATINFMFGPVEEIAGSLIQMTYSPSTAAGKYPVIALFTDISEKRGINTDTWAEVSLNMMVATITDGNYLASERLTQSFKAVLSPIYDVFLQQLVRSHYFNVDHPDLVPHNKIDRYNWGKRQITAEGQGAGDFIDAIELQNVVLRANAYYCKKMYKP